MFWGSSGDVPGMIRGSPGRFPDVKNDEISRFFEKIMSKKKKNDVEKRYNYENSRIVFSM